MTSTLRLKSSLLAVFCMLLLNPLNLQALTGGPLSQPCANSAHPQSGIQIGTALQQTIIDACPTVTPSPVPTEAPPPPTPTCCIGNESSPQHCNDGIDNDCDGFADSIESTSRPPGVPPDPGCCLDDLLGCTTAIIENNECRHMPIPGCKPCMFPSECEDLDPHTLNLCVSGRCVFHRLD